MAMNAKWRKGVLTLIIVILLFGFARTNIILTFSDARRIDLFTQKIPYNGKGPNAPSDAFQPQELVILYANVTYNDYPVANALVAFQIDNPRNEFWNMTIIGTNSTDSSGIAQFSFRIPWPIENPEDVVFGEWVSVATVDVAGVVVRDSLTFKVGWILEITKLEILNGFLTPQTKFFLEETIIFNLTIENIAFIQKIGTITIDALDANKNPIIHAEIDNIVFQPGVNHVNVTSSIPKTSAVGESTVSAVAHVALPEEGGVPYCPPVSSTFEVLAPSIKQYYLTVKTDPHSISVLHPIYGEGWYNEGSVINLFAPKEIQYVNMGVRYLFLYWDVDGDAQDPGANTISVVMDNNHTATAHYVLQYYLTIKVDPAGVATISGEGWYDAGANVTLSAPLVSGYNFSSWDVNGVSQGSGVSVITVFMDMPKTATAHYVREVGAWPWPIPDWFYWLLLLLLLLLIIILLILYYRRRKRKEAGEFHSGWTAWYYRYDMLGKGKSN